MRTFSLLKGLPIFELKTGSKIGEVCDLNISNNGLVRGLLVKKGVFFKKTYVINVKNVSSFGFDGVMIEDREVLKPLTEHKEFTFENRRDRLFGRMMMTNEGERLGMLEDVYFLEEAGTIVGYELSDGFFSDIMEGKRVVKTDEPPAIGKDAIIVNVK
ncbi:PRC-barrel domain-containing protein [Bacillus sp. V3B]|uniref:PRC-barrel domain-containing protein n=1 Tax=Bacillus sp. V3B TaxID=2804915 RepID=UPI00210BEFBF|nr:PRC-barrel domain-containing protein [Bacillus sp. V3B]MCQ6273581.1 PRC-barrel domain-containing protein [Bacillus sp. V3B]